jgi:uncharacterized protein YodC (DUF2158 family)
MKSEHKFAVGATVSQGTGTPKMTVQTVMISTGGVSYDCTWWSMLGIYNRHTFAEEILEESEGE